MNASILPCEPAGSVNAPRRPLSPAGGRDDFAGAMDDALDTRAARRTDSGARASRRTEPVRAREMSASKTAASPRNVAHSEKAVAAKTADRADEPEAKDVERRDEPSKEGCAASDSPAQPAEEAKAAADATEPGATSADMAAGTDVAVDAGAAAATDAATGTAAAEEDEAIPAERLARGRRGDGVPEAQAGEQGTAVRTGVPRAVTGAVGKGAHQRQPAPGHAVEVAATSSAPLVEALHQVKAAAAQSEAASTAAKDGVATQAVETAIAKPPTASAADAVTAMETVVANVASAAASETSAGSDANGADPREQSQPKPQTSGPQLKAVEGVAVAGGPSDGVRFTVNGAAGNAAYTNATPRQEEAVLPQIVQSIRLHAVQGTTEARVQLKPEHLGALNITLKVEQNQVTATIQADVAAVRAWIESHESSLRQALSEQGLQLARLVVQEDGQQASKDEQPGDRPQRQPRRRSWRDEEVTFEVLA